MTEEPSRLWFWLLVALGYVIALLYWVHVANIGEPADIRWTRADFDGECADLVWVLAEDTRTWVLDTARSCDDRDVLYQRQETS